MTHEHSGTLIRKSLPVISLQKTRNNVLALKIYLYCTHCVLRVNAAEVIDEGRLRPLMISCHCFLLMTSTRPPREVTRLYNSYKSKTCLAMMGKRLIGVPGKEREREKYKYRKTENLNTRSIKSAADLAD